MKTNKQRRCDIGMKIRVKFGRNPYSNRFTCSHCRRGFSANGLILRIEYISSVIDIPICPDCAETYDLFEGIINLDKHSPSHPIGIA
jgi:hypothetical protein